MRIRKLTGKSFLVLLIITLSRLDVSAQKADSLIFIPLGGNAWLKANASARIDDKGLTEWTNSKDVINAYFRVKSAGDLNLGLRLRTPDGGVNIGITALHKTLIKTVLSADYSIVNFGTVAVTAPGYIKVDIRGINTLAAKIADVSDLVISGPATKNGVAYVKDNHNNFFYWGRRGPSVHLNYTVPQAAKNTVEWFYNEVTVPVGQDVQGSYFMANGFSGGYFGMQVNSPAERRILFSVWSPYTTDDPKSIPEHLKVKLLKKGEGVHGGEFGGEGSGGQSYMVYPWVAGQTYCFLVRAQGDIAAETTIYTAYFKLRDDARWQLVASFKRPQSGSYLNGLHSFLENFDPATGNQSRKVLFGNQWIVDIDRKWYPLNEALFTGDETANINYRKDYAGGAQDGQFYLQNCGFFNDFVNLRTTFNKPASTQKHPEIDFDKLP